MNKTFSKTGVNAVGRGAAHAPDAQLHPQAKALISRLPEGARLDQLAAEYPRIADRIAYDWLHPEALKPYLSSLLTTDRPGREGFSFNVLSELVAFQTYYSTHVFPVRKTVWEDVL